MKLTTEFMKEAGIDLSKPFQNKIATDTIRDLMVKYSRQFKEMSEKIWKAAWDARNFYSKDYDIHSNDDVCLEDWKEWTKNNHF